MPTSDEEAQKTRAQRLREQISKISSQDVQDEAALPETDQVGLESPREFIQRKMREAELKTAEEAPKAKPSGHRKASKSSRKSAKRSKKK